ncbi:BTB/POZ and MATH domain-containing protein 2-like [Panicum miliaceum]|uniref:BTB/POZ and MATH domain-containing protein 2-like n=1 Tax=Panicum miliaceum TaxID=4540 RepID=A0A3L6T411_PANMI|nr:BTB/POZ and MATH domain-containing protein 2-like [Panicum miliaceum]
MSSPSSSDQLPSLGDSWRRLRDALSFSSVRVRRDTGTHLFHVGRYSRVEGSPGECIESAFRAGGRRWKLFYYPNGDRAKRRGQACAKLMLEDWGFFSGIREARAEYRVSILGRDGEPVRSGAVGPHRYFPGLKPSYRVDVLPTPNEQSSALPLMEDDSLVVRCDVTVLNVYRESRIKWYLRNLLN